jgi:ubiquinone/menaquinone biosynthesis C-methylase UbiE
MQALTGIGLGDVQAVYSGPEGRLWELIMGEQVHVGGMASSMDLAERAGIAAGWSGIDLCCCSGAGMRFLARMRGVARMTGVDATAAMITLGRERCQAEGLDDRIAFVHAEATVSGLPDAQADFVWGEDAWCYVVDKPALIAEAARLVRPGGTIAFTDWVEGEAGLESAQAERFLRFMKFPTLARAEDYRDLLERAGCRVETAMNTERFAPAIDLYLAMLEQQLTYDALKIIGFNQDLMGALAAEMHWARDMAHAGHVAQGLFVARRAN